MYGAVKRTHKVHIFIFQEERSTRPAVNMSYEKFTVLSGEMRSPWPEHLRMAELEGARLDKLFCKIALYSGNLAARISTF